MQYFTFVPTMLRYGFFLFGSFIIFLTHVHAFVLLTANVGDLKRIAQKFVPEAVADNIAGFIAKASESLTGVNISEENNENYKESESEDSKDLEDAQSISDEVTTQPTIVSIDSIQDISIERYHNKKSILENDKKRKRKLNQDKVDVNEKEVESNKVYQRHKTNDDVYVNPENYESKTLHQHKKTNEKFTINPAKVSSKKVYQRKKNDKVNVKPKRGKSQKVYQRQKINSPQNILEIKVEYDESEQSEERNNVDAKSFTAGLDVFSEENKPLKKSSIVDSFNRYSNVNFQKNILVKTTRNSKYFELESNEDIESKTKHANEVSLNQDGGKLKSKYSKRVESNESIDNSQKKYSKGVESNESKDKSQKKYSQGVESNESKDISKSAYSHEFNEDNKHEVDRSGTLTTRIERNEFDQYVNLDYPRSELVATSGPLALTMVVDTRIN